MRVTACHTHWEGAPCLHNRLSGTQRALTPPSLSTSPLSTSCKPGLISQLLSRWGQETDPSENWGGGPKVHRASRATAQELDPHRNAGSRGTALKLCAPTAFGERHFRSAYISGGQTAQPPANCNQYLGYYAEHGAKELTS